MSADDSSKEIGPEIPPDENHRYECEALCKTAVESVKVIKTNIPAQNEFEYYSAYPKYKSVIGKLNSQIFNTLNTILKSERIHHEFHHEQIQTGFDDKFDILVETNDEILEKVGNLVDEICGFKSTSSAVVVENAESSSTVASWNKKKHAQRTKKDFQRFSCLNWLDKPQEKFEDVPENSTLPFVPKLKLGKPNSVSKLSKFYCSFVAGEFDDKLSEVRKLGIMERKLPFSDKQIEELTNHKYLNELLHFVPKNELLKPVKVREASKITDENLHYIDTISAFENCIKVLEQEKEIAVDLEAHSHRSFLGFVCLIQISTRENDYLIDTLVLRSQIERLNTVFTNPSIVKVMHGCDSDVIWLQRDFGVYLVNVFDTGQASRVLNYPTFSLSYLLKRFTNFDAEKQYQLADWRQRPLPSEMLHYARMDTHSLLYVADLLRNKLIELGNDSIFTVFDRSRTICLKKFHKPYFDETTYQKLLTPMRKKLNNQQEYTLAKLYEWREKTARSLDESLGYVLPNHMLIRISEVLPRETQGILACCNPVPPLVREYLSVLHRIISEAKWKVNETSNEVHKIHYESQVSLNPNTDSLLNQPHDMHSERENTLSFQSLTDSLSELVLDRPNVSMFDAKHDKRGLPESVLDLLSELNHPLDMFLPNLSTGHVKFMESSEKHADCLRLKESRKRPQINHRWRLKSHADIVGQSLISSHIKKLRKSVENGGVRSPITETIIQDDGQEIIIELSDDENEDAAVENNTPNTESNVEIPIVFDNNEEETPPTKKLKKEKKTKLPKSEKKKEKMKKKRVISHPLMPLKKRKLNSEKTPSKTSEGNADSGDDDHPSLIPKKKAKTILPKLKPLINRSSIMK